MKCKVFPNRVAAERAQGVIDKALGHPTRGVHVGKGPHVDLDDGSLVGHTTSECAVYEAQDGTGEACIVLTERAHGLQVRDLVVNGSLVRLDFGDAVDELPERFRDRTDGPELDPRKP